MKKIAAFLLAATILISEISMNPMLLQAQELSPVPAKGEDGFESATTPEENGSEEVAGTEAKDNISPDDKSSDETSQGDSSQDETSSDETSPDDKYSGETHESEDASTDGTTPEVSGPEDTTPNDSITKEEKTEGNPESKKSVKETKSVEPTEEEELSDSYEEHKKAFADLLAHHDVLATNCDDADLKSQPQESADTVKQIPAGRQLLLKAVEIIDNVVWYQVETAIHDIEYIGYLKNQYVISPDTGFQEWKEQYGIDDIHPEGEVSPTGAGNTDLSAFPSSYRSHIKKLIEAHPNWTFVPMKTGLDWNTVISNEMSPQRSLVPSYSMNTWKSTAANAYNIETGEWYEFSGGGWVQASESIVRYYMDPRNFLNETSVFQFELLTFNNSLHKESGVEAVLKNTFMSKKKLEDGSGGGITYAKAFVQIGKQLNVSPFFLASRVKQEQGTKGTSDLISGKYKGYKGLYNYFNIQATGLTREEVIVNGLEEAKNAGWTNRYKALSGGAEKTADRYIRRGQDTLYLQKFDVDDSYDGLYWHQYMQNLLAADNEGKSVRNAYSDMGLMNNSFIFKIPVYNNMPSSASKMPTETLSKPSLKISTSNLTKVTLKWSAVAGATGYYIYRSDKPDSGFKKVKTITSMGTTSFSQTVALNQTYYYRVRAYLTILGGPVYSSYSSVNQVSTKLTAPAWGSVKTSSYTRVKVSWKKTAGVSGYQVYRKTGKNGKYARIKTINSAASGSYTDTSAQPNQTYYYKVRSFLKTDKTYYSGFNKERSVSTKLAKPAITSTTLSGKTSLVLKWNADKWASGYRIFRAESKKGKYSRIKTVNGSNNTTYTDTGLKANKVYYYKVKSFVTVNGSRKFSAYSGAFKGRTGLTRPSVTSVTTPSASRVKLRWKQTASATGYQIYRAASKNGKYSLVKTIKKNTTLTYTDKNLKSGRTYYYKIRAYSTVKGNIRYSKFSARKSASLKK